MGLTIDHSGRIAKRPTVKDVAANKDVPFSECLVTFLSCCFN